MRLASDVHLVGSGDSGFDLSDRFDCNVYLVDGGGEAALVDAGIGAGVDAILARAESAGVPAEAIRYLLLTHAHPDHAGGAAALKERLPHLVVIASASVAAWVRTGDEEAMSLEIGKRSEFYPSDYAFEACPVDRELGEGDRVRVGRLDVETIETPGHAAGHLSFRFSGAAGVTLLSGDLVFFGGQISLENTWDCRIQDYAASMAKLRAARVDALLPGHHFVSLRNGQRHIDAANRLFDRGFVPRSVV